MKYSVLSVNSRSLWPLETTFFSGADNSRGKDMTAYFDALTTAKENWLRYFDDANRRGWFDYEKTKKTNFRRCGWQKEFH